MAHDKLRRIDYAFRIAVRRFFQRSYVTGVTIGEKMKDGGYLREIVVRVHVREKMPENLLRKNQVFPREIDGVPLDVVERIYEARAGAALTPEEKRIRRRFPVDPLQPGISIGRQDGPPGTLGLVVWDLATGAPGFLTAAHVFRPRRIGPDPLISRRILQPAEDRGWPPDQTTIGQGFRWTWDGCGDAAFAPLELNRRINPEPFKLEQFGRYVRRARRAEQGDVLVKSGQKTGVTLGRVESVGKIEVDYGDDDKLAMKGFEVRPLLEENPLGEEISEGGDSGSIWFHRDSMRPVGISVAGDRPGTVDRDEHALACHLSEVLEDLDVSLEPLEDSPRFLETDLPAQRFSA